MERMNERQISHFPDGGHDHDGVNSTPVKMPPKSIHMEMLGEDVVNFILSVGGGIPTTTGIGYIPDLIFETDTIAIGDSVTGEADWVGTCLVRYTRIVMSLDTTCTLSFYHSGSDDENREFRAINCVHDFLWEGPWVHFDDTGQSKIFWKIENTGTSESIFKVILKAGSLGDYVVQ